MSRTRTLTGLLAALLLCLAVPALAAPGLARADSSYAVDACNASQNNFFAFSENTGSFDHAATCPDGNAAKGYGLQVWSTGADSGSNAAGWWFYTPTGTTVTRVNHVNATFSAYKGWVAHFATSTGGGGDPFPAGDDCPSTGGCAVTPKLEGPVNVPNATTFGIGIYCDAASCPANDSESLYGPAGSANIGDVNLQLDDSYTQPKITGVGGSLWGHSGWVNGNTAASTLSATAAAQDPGGVCTLQISMSGPTAVAPGTNNAAPDGDDAAPCAPGVNGPSNAIPAKTVGFAPDLAKLATGVYTLTVTATNPGGGTATASSALAVDTSGPATTVTAIGGANVTVNATDAGSGVASVSCSGPDAPASIPAADLPYTFTISQLGTDHVSCTGTDNVGNQGPAAGATLNVTQAALGQGNGVSQTTPAAPKTKARLPRMAIRFHLYWSWKGPTSELDRLATIGRLPRGARIAFSCRGRGCPRFQKPHVAKRGAAPDFHEIVATVLHHHFRAGDVFDIVLSAPHHTSEKIAARIENGKIPRLKRES